MRTEREWNISHSVLLVATRPASRQPREREREREREGERRKKEKEKRARASELRSRYSKTSFEELLPFGGMDNANILKVNILSTKGGSPGLVVMGGDLCSKRCEFESWHCIL